MQVSHRSDVHFHPWSTCAWYRANVASLSFCIVGIALGGYSLDALSLTGKERTRMAERLSSVGHAGKVGCPLLAQSRHELVHCTCPLRPSQYNPGYASAWRADKKRRY